MPRIVVKRNNRTYKEFLLRPFQSRVTVGSQGDNDLILADVAVRGHHFTIYKKNSHYFLEPLDGVTTTKLNGKNVIASTRIKSGDVIEIGAHKLLFDNELHESRPVETADAAENDIERAAPEIETETPEKDVATAKAKKEIFNEIDEMTAEEQPEKPAVETEEESSEPHFLIAIYGPYLGNVYQLNAVTTKIGRDRLLNDIVIARTPSGKTDASISRRHATIVHSEGCYYVLDKRSKTRTRVNGKELAPDQVLQLYPNDEVEIVSDRKSTILRFCTKNRMNFSRPNKSGTWWLRNRHRAALFFSVAAILILALVIFKFAKQLSIAQQKPKNLEITNSVFFQQANDPNAETIMNEADASAPFHSMAAADFNGDHFVDVVFFDKLGYLTIINGRTKRDLWERGARVRGLANSTIALVDLNENGLNDIVVAGFNTVISAFEGKSGMEFWSSQILGGEFTGTPIVGKLNSDPYPDVFVASRQGILDVGIGNYGESAWKSLNLKMNISTPPIAKDVDGDGLPEIFFASETGKIFSAKLTKDSLSVKTIADLSQISDLKKSRIINPFFFADVDGDKKTDVLALSEENALIAINMNGGGVRAKKLPLAADSGQTAVALIREFGKREMKKIVTATFSEMKCFPLNAIFADDNADAVWTSHLPQGKFLPRQMAVADVDKDKIQDVIVPILPPGIAVISGKTGRTLTSYAQKSRDSAFPIGSPVVADFNNDTFIDILQRMSDNSFQLFSTNSRIPGGAVLWGQMKGNSLQNMEAIIRLKPKWFFPATILLASLLIFVIFAVNFIVIERRRSLFPHEIAND